jgi:hypothetical protein
LLNYLNLPPSGVPESNYFKEEKDLDECYKKQLNFIANIIFENLTAINDFFEINYDSNMKELKKFILSKYPNLFKTV